MIIFISVYRNNLCAVNYISDLNFKYFQIYITCYIYSKLFAPASLSACWSPTTIRWRFRISARPKSSATRAPRCPLLVRWPGWPPRSYAMNPCQRRWIFGRCHIPLKLSETLSASFMISLICHRIWLAAAFCSTGHRIMFPENLFTITYNISLHEIL